MARLLPGPSAPGVSLRPQPALSQQRGAPSPGCRAPSHPPPGPRGRGEAGPAGQGHARVAEGTGRGGGLQRQGCECQPDRNPRATLQIAAVSRPGPASLPAFRTLGIFSPFFPRLLLCPCHLPAVHPPRPVPTRDAFCAGGAESAAGARRPATRSRVPEVE